MSKAFNQVDSGQSMAEMWDGFATLVIPDCPRGTMQHDEMEKAFYSGALCLFNWFMVQLDEGIEPTDSDLNRVTLMDAEINGFFTREKSQ